MYIQQRGKNYANTLHFNYYHSFPIKTENSPPKFASQPDAV